MANEHKALQEDLAQFIDSNPKIGEKDLLRKWIIDREGVYTCLNWALRGDPKTGERLFDTMAASPARHLTTFLTALNDDR